MEAIRIPETEDFSAKVAKRRVGTTDIIAAVSKDLRGDIFVRISYLPEKFECSIATFLLPITIIQ